MRLHHEAHASADITAAFEVLSYTHDGDKPAEVQVRVNLGTGDTMIAGGAAYDLTVYINDTAMSPVGRVPVVVGQHKAVIQSRTFTLEPADELRVTVLGTATDDEVSLEAFLFDMTPAQVEDLVGTGAVLVDHNYPNDDDLVVRTPGGAGIAEVTILAYLKSDYDANHRGQSFVRGQAVTNANGNWVQPLRLTPDTYTLVFATPGYLLGVQELTVA